MVMLNVEKLPGKMIQISRALGMTLTQSWWRLWGQFFGYFGSRDTTFWRYREPWASISGAGTSNVSKWTNKDTHKVKMGLKWSPGKSIKSRKTHEKSYQYCAQKWTPKISNNRDPQIGKSMGFAWEGLQNPWFPGIGQRDPKKHRNWDEMEAKVIWNAIWRHIENW